MSVTAVARNSRHRAQRQRQARSVAQPDAPAIRLTERDTWMLDALARMRFLTTSLLALLFFAGSRDAANKRLRRLLDAGYVKAWVVNLARDNVYSLTRRGLIVLGPAAERTTASVPRSLDGNLDHLLSINVVRVALASTLPDTEGELLWWRSDWELRTHHRQRTIPDALLGVSWPDGDEQVFALEVEHRTRALRSLQGKVLRYSAAAYRPGGLFGQTTPVVLIVGLNPAWLARYRAALAALPLSLTLGFATLRDVERAGVGAVWQPLSGDSRLSLRTLESLPYGTEGRALECRGVSRGCVAGVAHTSPFRTERTGRL